MTEYSDNLTEADVEAVLRATIERLIEDAMIDAEVDYPAGSDAGHRISWDSDSLLNGIMALIPAPAPAEQEPVAVIGKDYRLLWSDAGSMSEIVAKHRITVGSPLYAHPAPVPAVPDDVAKVRNALRSHSYIGGLDALMDKAAEALEAQAAELARLRGFAEFVTTWAVSFRTSDRDDTVWTTDQWRELRRQIAAITQPTEAHQ